MCAFWKAIVIFYVWDTQNTLDRHNFGPICKSTTRMAF